MKNDPFSAYGIQHLSPSSCNLFEAQPAAFVLQKCFKKGGEVGAAAYRGTAVELGIVHGLQTGAHEQECMQVAAKEFWRLTALSADPRRDKEEAAVPEMVRIGLAELKAYGTPTSSQGKIEYKVDDLAVPLIGYYDLEWSNRNLIVDLKTTHALPSKISGKHARQVALYCAAKGSNVEGRLTYVTSKKAATYQLENIADHVKSLERIALTIQNFLSISTDPMVLARHCVPDRDSFYFNDPEMKQAAWDIWGI